MSTSGVAAITGTARGETIKELDDLDLVRRSKRGNREAFSELVRRHQQIVYNVAYRFMREPAMAEDMSQEAFVKAFRLLKGFRGDCSFSTWMYRVTCSVCLTELSRRKKRGEVSLQPKHIGQAATLPDENFDMPEHIRRCVTMLPDRYATIVALYYLQGVSYDEIARAMSIPMGTLKTWMHRARKQLRKIVKEELFSDA
ncbi:MAG: RNA polymerase sigma factor [Candidatus Hydrogenedentota bacterium]